MKVREFDIEHQHSDEAQKDNSCIPARREFDIGGMPRDEGGMGIFIQLVIGITLLSFIFLWLFDSFKGYLHEYEKKLLQDHFFDRINKEKYLEEAGYNVMNDPW